LAVFIYLNNLKFMFLFLNFGFDVFPLKIFTGTHFEVN